MVLPILFNTEMVRAILDGRKTATRRLIVPRNQRLAKELGYRQGSGLWIDHGTDNGDKEGHIKDYSVSPCWMSYSWYIQRYAPYRPGDTLYVRETWNANPLHDYGDESNQYVYKADYDGHGGEFGWKPSIHMPKEAARIWLKVTDVRLERLQEMSLDDFLNEGIVILPEAFNDPENAFWQAKREFEELWNSTIKKQDIARYGWDATPWVWVIKFERCEKPESERG